MLADSGLHRHPFFCACRMLVGADDARIQNQPFQVGVLQLAKNPLPDSFARPTIKPSPDGVPFAEAFWKIAPGSTGLRNPKNRVNEKSVVGSSHAGVAFLARQKSLIRSQCSSEIAWRQSMAGPPWLVKMGPAVYTHRPDIVHTA